MNAVTLDSKYWKVLLATCGIDNPRVKYWY